MKEDILHNLTLINERIRKSCEQSGRNSNEVRLLLATKTVFYRPYQNCFGERTELIAENKVQELKEKYEDLKDIPHENHFISHLQTNKIKDILEIRCYLRPVSGSTGTC